MLELSSKVISQPYNRITPSSNGGNGRSNPRTSMMWARKRRRTKVTNKVDENITRRLMRRFPQVDEKITRYVPLPEMRGLRHVRLSDGRTSYGLQAIR